MNDPCVLNRHAWAHNHPHLQANWEAHLAHFRQQLRQPQYHVLLTHTGVELGAAALPKQRQFLQAVSLALPGPSGFSGSVQLIWQLGMQANGCWMVTGIHTMQQGS